MISIIIPTLNEEKVLEQTILSLRKLNVFPYEIIVSDGKSTDKTLDIAKKYADRVVEYKDTARQTIAQGRNLGASVARGDYLVFIDADVVIPDINNFFIKAIGLFEKPRKKKLIGLTVFVKVFPEMRTFSDGLFFDILNFANYFLNNILNKGSAIGEFQMIPTEVFKKVNGYNEKIVVGEDAEMFRRLSHIGQVYTEMSLNVFHTSRRAHNVGWPSLLFFTLKNMIHLKLFKRSSVLEWEPIR
jgi:glycosyltransferase involved in cell wall biosynthesis